MKKTTIMLLAIALSVPGLLAAQDRSIQAIDPVRSYDGTVEYKKTTLAAKVFEFRYPAKDVTNAIGQYLEQRGGKLRNNNGLTSVSSVRLHDSDDRTYDVYYQVKGKGSGERALSTLSVILAEPGEDILSRGLTGEGAAAGGAPLPQVFSSLGAEGFFGDLGVLIGNYDHSQMTSSREKDLRGAERRYKKLVDKGRSLERQRQKIEREISVNMEQQRAQARELDRVKLLLDQIKNKRRG